MKLEDAQALAEAHMEDRGLLQLGWKFRFDSAIKRFGCCCFTTKTISLSEVMVKCNLESEVEDTILHEIAHALVGVGHRHDQIWASKAKELGAVPERYYDSGERRVQVPFRWVAVCPSCSFIHTSVGKPVRTHLCAMCAASPVLTYKQCNGVRAVGGNADKTGVGHAA